MEFWGVEVKPGKSLKVSVDAEKVLHLSQATFGEFKKDKVNEWVPLFVKFNNQKLVLGHLSPENLPQQSFDLVFEKEFELSHNWKHGSVYFTGYQSVLPDDSPDDYSDYEDESDGELPMISAENGKAAPKVENVKPAAAKAIVTKSEQPSKDIKSKVDDEEDDESDEEDDSSDDIGLDSDEDDDDDDESDEEDDETPVKADLGKKRPAESATKTPVPAKKAKAATPQKTDGKKGGHTATPHPSKQAGKLPANGTPKSGGQFTCQSCSKTFNSDGGLQSHTKAKHSAK